MLRPDKEGRRFDPDKLLRAPLTRRAFVAGGLATLVAACSRDSGDDDQAEEAAPTVDETEGLSAETPTAIPEPTEPPEPEPTATQVPPTPVPPTPVPEPTPPPPEPTPTPVPQLSMFQQLNQSSAWEGAVRTPAGHIMGRVNNGSLNIRSEPDIDADVVSTTYAGHTLQIYDVVQGYPVDGDDRWFQVGSNEYVAGALMEPFVASTPPETFEDMWLDVNLSNFYAVVYNWGTPRYGAIITAGRGDRTPIGTFQVMYRVPSDTMDSATVGIEEGDPEYYYLEDVRYVQYFKDGGYAVHGNYWSEPQNFGRFSSNGCVSLKNHDAEWVWELTDVGSVVNIHF